jgi:hypothetical protein
MKIDLVSMLKNNVCKSGRGHDSLLSRESSFTPPSATELLSMQRARAISRSEAKKVMTIRNGSMEFWRCMQHFNGHS